MVWEAESSWVRRADGSHMYSYPLDSMIWVVAERKGHFSLFSLYYLGLARSGRVSMPCHVQTPNSELQTPMSKVQSRKSEVWSLKIGKLSSIATTGSGGQQFGSVSLRSHPPFGASIGLTRANCRAEERSFTCFVGRFLQTSDSTIIRLIAGEPWICTNVLGFVLYHVR